MEEVWKDVKGFEGLYKVSNKGNIKSLNYNKTKKEKKLCKVKYKSGYLYVNLWKQCKQKNYAVHRLVAQAFIENPNNYHCVNHKDENKQNNVVSNLEWCTYKYNCNYGSRNSRAGKSIAKALSKQVYQYSKDFELIAVWKSTRECGRNGYKQCQVAACCRGKIKSHKGFLWSYTPLNNKSS